MNHGPRMVTWSAAFTVAHTYRDHGPDGPDGRASSIASVDQLRPELAMRLTTAQYPDFPARPSLSGSSAGVLS